MTKDEVIELAREAGGADISSHGWTSWVGTQSTEFLERFAKLAVALAAEREREALLSMQAKLTAPWVSLTYEEIRHIALNTPIDGTNFARAIEAKLKEKNHAI